MSNLNTVKQWKKYYIDRGIPSEIYNQYLPYIHKLNTSDCPVIFEFDHLAYSLGIKRDVLAKMINAAESFYRTFTIPKRRGGKRQISSPYPTLLECQKWVYRNILLKQDVSECAHGFVPARSIITNASVHLSNNVILKMDLKDFFPSIPINWVIQFFKELGYASNVAYYLSSLCCLNGALVQGAATSPYLSNILLRSLDERLCKISDKYNAKYTRYADDLTFSGDYVPSGMISIISDIVKDYGLVVNESKTKLLINKEQKIITGISVSGDKLRLPRKTKRKLKQEIFYIKKYGYLSHVNKVKVNNPMYIDSLIGKLQFWLQVEPESEDAVKGIIYLTDYKNSN